MGANKRKSPDRGGRAIVHLVGDPGGSIGVHSWFLEKEKTRHLAAPRRSSIRSWMSAIVQ
jgi:hypothetical protein